METGPVKTIPVSRADLIFSSVFPPSGFADGWPVTPSPNHRAPGQTNPAGHADPSAVDSDRDTKRAHAWEIATRYLTLIATSADPRRGGLLWEGRPHITREVHNALAYLFFGQGIAFVENGEENLVSD